MSIKDKGKNGIPIFFTPKVFYPKARVHLYCRLSSKSYIPKKNRYRVLSLDLGPLSLSVVPVEELHHQIIFSVRFEYISTPPTQMYIVVEIILYIYIISGSQTMTSPYNFTFTTGSLYFSESLEIIELYLKVQSWETVKKDCLSINLIQAKTQSSLRKVSLEVIARLKHLTDQEIVHFKEAPLSEQKYLLWLSICRRYRFIREFAKEVLREKFISLVPILTYKDFDSFFHRKCDWHPELENLAESTKIKIREVIFRMMRETGLLNKENMIVRPLFHHDFQILIQNKNELLYFPIFDADIIPVQQ